MNKSVRLVVFITLAVLAVAEGADAEERPIKTFILAGQSNMVGWGDSTKLPDKMRRGNDRVLMFENGRWQRLRPHSPVLQGQKRFGLTEYHFGPEISFGNALARAYPEETIGIIKLASGGSSILAWKRDWSKADADRVGQGGRGSLYKKLIEKINHARSEREIKLDGFVWQQGGGDMKNEDVAKEYLDNLKSFVAAIREDCGVSDLKFVYGTPRSDGIPDDLSKLFPEKMSGRYPWAQYVIKAQFDARNLIPNSKMVIVRDVAKHPHNVHFNTAGQLELGRLFAAGFLD